MKKLISLISIFVLCLLVTGCGNEKGMKEENVDPIGYVSKENVVEVVGKFNANVLENNKELNVARDDGYVAENNAYYYYLEDDVTLFLNPVKFTGNKEKDIVETCGIYYDNGSLNEEKALEYIKNLIKANTAKEFDVSAFMKEAKNKSIDKLNATNGSGILLAYITGDNRIQYEVFRNYKEEK